MKMECKSMLVIEGMENCIIKDNIKIKISGYKDTIERNRNWKSGIRDLFY